MSNFDVKYKVLLLGEAAVGKTCLIRALSGDSFTTNLVPTVGIDFVSKVFDVDGAKVSLQIWDTAGQERFRTITKSHFRGTKGILLVYDITNKESFNNLNYWLQSLDAEFLTAEDTPQVYIIGNKLDLAQKRQVSYDQGKKVVEQNFDRGFDETSAKTGENIQETFQNLASILIHEYHPKVVEICRNKKAGISENTNRRKPFYDGLHRDSIMLSPETIKEIKNKDSCCGS